MKKGFLLALLCMWGGAHAQNLQPIDPLERPKTGAGSSSFSVSAGYQPDTFGGGISVGGDIGLSATYNVTEQLAVTASTGFSARQNQFIDADGSVEKKGEADWHGLGLGAQYTFDGRYAPSIGLDVDLPMNDSGVNVTASTSASLLRDPIILDGTVAATYRSEGSNSVSAGAGVGFVVNDAVTLRGDAVQSLTFGELTVPSTYLGFGGAYKLDEKNSVTAKATLKLVAGEAQSGVRVGYLFRP